VQPLTSIFCIVKPHWFTNDAPLFTVFNDFDDSCILHFKEIIISTIDMNATYNSSICIRTTPPDPPPPTAAQVCAIPLGISQGVNLTTILTKCCGSGAQIAPYGSFYANLGFDCFQYCNITQPGLNYTQVEQCIEDSEGSLHFGWNCGPTETEESSASRATTGNLVWAMFGIVMTGFLLGNNPL
jgi:hypothetical protein